MAIALCVYVAKSSIGNLAIGLREGVWGFPSPPPDSRKAVYSGLPIGSLVLFGYGHSGTNEQADFQAGALDRVYVCRLDEPYFEGADAVWPNQTPQQQYNSRIGIETVSCLEDVSLTPGVDLTGAVVEAFRSGFRNGQGFEADPSGSPKLDPIIQALPPAGVPMELNSVPAPGRSGGQGIQTDPRKRICIEIAAEDAAQERYEADGYTVERVGPQKRGYDLHCTHPSHGTKHVEVKGTTSIGDHVQLTVNEVDWAAGNPTTSELWVQAGIKTKPAIGGGSAVASPGSCRYSGPFEPTGGQPFKPSLGPLLRATRFEFKVP